MNASGAIKANVGRWLALPIALATLGVVVAKAYLLNITHDEAYTFLNYPHQSFMDILSYKQWYTNNHLLNSLFMKYSIQLFGTSELALRLPNVLLFALYIGYAAALFWRDNKWLLLGMVTLLCTNPVLTDLFGLARGYGMSCAFMLMGLYHYTSHARTRARKHIYLFHGAFLLAVLSNFTLLTTYAAMLLVHNLLALATARAGVGQPFHWWRTNRVHLLPFLINTVILYEPVRRVLTYNDLGFGGKTGFYADTVFNLFIISLHHTIPPSWGVLLGQIAITALVLGTSGLVIQQVWKRNDAFLQAHRPLVVINALCVLLALLIVLLHHALGTDYPVTRFSVYLLPLLLLHVGFLLRYWLHSSKRVLALAVVLPMALASAVHFGATAQFDWASEWRYDCQTREMLVVLEKLHQQGDASEPLRLGISWVYEPTINYYKQTQQLTWLAPVDREGFDANDDYYYVWRDQFAEVQGLNFEIVHEFTTANAVLLKP